MKRTLLRIFVVAVLVGLGMLAIAHAQRPAMPQQDDGPPNPLRPESSPPPDNRPPNYRDKELGPVDTIPPRDNPLRRRPASEGKGDSPVFADKNSAPAPSALSQAKNRPTSAAATRPVRLGLKRASRG